MKIGLLTTYSFNYGSYHQAVALQNKLEDMGHECEIINERIKKYKWLNLFCLYTIDPILPTPLKKYVGKLLPQYNSYLMIKNDTKKIKTSPPNMRNLHKLSKRYDVIVVGSDELWSADNSSIRFCPENFGYGWDCPIISYATCAVKLDTDNCNLKNKITSGLDKFLAISVRDELSKEKVNKINSNVDVEVVIDPTLLNPFFIKKIEDAVGEKYILLYGQHYDDEQRKLILKMAEEENASIYSVGWPQEWGSRFVNVKSADELQKMFAQACFCFPSTFHGTIFSILNHKQFISMLNPLRGEKIKILLEEIELQDRIYKKDMKVNDLEFIDYIKVENRLKKLRDKSEAYLNRALRKVEEYEK